MSIKMNVEQFIKQHEYINYCEAIIDKEGMIQYVRPNHVQTLIRETNLPEDLIWAMMPIEAAPIDWLVNFTGCVSVWFDLLYKPKDGITPAQETAIQKLIEAEIILGELDYGNDITDEFVEEAENGFRSGLWS